jgi:hypothetical protein
MATYDARPSAFTQLSTTADWEALLSMIGPPAAIDASVGNAMTPSLDAGGRNAVIDTGNILIKGQLWRCDSSVSTAIPAASAQNRIDRLVLRLTRGASTSATVIQPAVITGTPGSSPVIPALTQTPTGIWEYPVCHWTSTSAGALTGLIDDRRLTNDPWHDMRPLSGGMFGTISGSSPPQYRFSDDCKFVEFAGHVQTPASAGNYNATAWYTMPNNYRMVGTTSTPSWPVTSVADGAASPVITLHNDGTLQFHYMPNSLAQTTIGIFGRYPLDDQNGYIQS